MLTFPLDSNGTLSGGHFMFTDFGPRESHWYAYPSARSTLGDRCLSFWYYMVDQCGELKVYVFVGGKGIYSDL